MSKNTLTTILLLAVMGFGGPAWSYDAAMAESYVELFASVQGAAAGKALHMIKPEPFLKKVKANKPIVALDIRTPAEAGIYGMTLPGSLAIPLNELFTKANLDRIPTDTTVVVLCKVGSRSAIAGTALRHIGFENVYILKGGFKALVGYMGPKEANKPVKPGPAKK